jgi:hypothetical protein
MANTDPQRRIQAGFGARHAFREAGRLWSKLCVVARQSCNDTKSHPSSRNRDRRCSSSTAGHGGFARACQGGRGMVSQRKQLRTCHVSPITRETSRARTSILSKWCREKGDATAPSCAATCETIVEPPAAVIADYVASASMGFAHRGLHRRDSTLASARAPEFDNRQGARIPSRWSGLCSLMSGAERIHATRSQQPDRPGLFHFCPECAPGPPRRWFHATVARNVRKRA